MNPEDINTFLNTPDDDDNESRSFELSQKTLMDDIGNELVAIRMIGSVRSEENNFLERLTETGFKGMPVFHEKYNHLEGKVPSSFITAYDEIAHNLNLLFEEGSLTLADVQQFEKDFIIVRNSFKTT